MLLPVSWCPSPPSTFPCIPDPKYFVAMPALNPNINHIALSVPNLEDAIKFYTSAFNVRQINDIMVIDLKGEESGPLNLSEHQLPAYSCVDHDI